MKEVYTIEEKTGGKLRLFMEPFISKTSADEESLAEFGRRRLGRWFGNRRHASGDQQQREHAPGAVHHAGPGFLFAVGMGLVDEPDCQGSAGNGEWGVLPFRRRRYEGG